MKQAERPVLRRWTRHESGLRIARSRKAAVYAAIGTLGADATIAPLAAPSAGIGDLLP
jgi:hypothetical protein